MDRSLESRDRALIRPTTMSRLQLREVRKSYGGQPAVRGVSISVEPGTLCSFLGPSGCGKTTCLNMVAGFLRPDSGEIRVGDLDVTAVPPHRRDMSMVFQGYALFPHLTVAGNVAFGLKMRGVPKEEIRRRVRSALDLVQLSPLEDRLPRELSGGQQQRVALARALVVSPKLLLLDEPLSNLDAKLREEMRVEVRSLQRRLGITTVYVTHDQEEALAISDQVVVMNGGRVEQAGSPEEIYDEPRTRFVAGFIGSANVLDVEHCRPGPGGITVSLPGLDRALTLAGPAEPAPEKPKLVVRTEHVRLGAGQEGWPARFLHSVFLGSTASATFRLGEAEIRARIDAAAVRRLRADEEVRLVVDPSRAVLVP